MSDEVITFELAAAMAASWAKSPGVRPPPPLGRAVAAQLLSKLQELGVVGDDGEIPPKSAGGAAPR